MEKNRKYALFFLLAVLVWDALQLAGLYNTMSVWLAAAVIVIIPALIISFFSKDEAVEKGGPLTDRVSGISSGIFGLLSSLLYVAIPVAIIAVAWLPMVGPVLSLSGFDVMKETYDAKRLQSEAVCSGDCQIGSTGIDLWYNDRNPESTGKIYIKNSENIAISRIVITTEYLYEGAMVQTYIGPYEFLTTVEGNVYSGGISLGKDISDVPCNGRCLPEVKKNKDGIPEAVPILIKTNKMDVYPVVWIFGINKPMMKMLWEPWMAFFGNNVLVGSYSKETPIKGKVTIASLGGQLRITKVEIYKKII